jgi:hypothetical protein
MEKYASISYLFVKIYIYFFLECSCKHNEYKWRIPAHALAVTLTNNKKHEIETLKQYANIAIKYLAAFPLYFLNHKFAKAETFSYERNMLNLGWQKKKNSPIM